MGSRSRAPSIAVWLLVACESGSATPRHKPEPSPRAVAGGPVEPSAHQHYTKLCAPCHAADGSGYTADHAPSLINPTFLESASDEFLRRSIIWGRPGTSMGAYGQALGGPLDDGAVDRLVALLRAKGPPARPLPAATKGDPTRGAPLYQEYCKSCHGDAKTRGEAPHLANPQFLMLATDPFIRHAIVVGRPNTKMLAFGKVMTDAQIDDVVAHVRALATAAAASQLLAPPTGREPIVLNPKGKDPVWKPRDGRFVSVDEVNQALAEHRRLAIIDARPPSDWRRVHIAGAVSIPYHDTKRLDELPAGVYAVAYCACPHHLSGIVADELVKRGHKTALVLDEGINVWHQRGYPVVAAEGVTPPALAGSGATPPAAPPAATAPARRP